MTQHNTPSPGVSSLEVERKYEASAEARLPDADSFARAGFAVGAPVVHRLVARYFDSANGDLAAQGVAVRERAGGKDAGWHLKERREDGVREVAWEPAPEMPEALAAQVAELTGGADVAPIAELRTTRTVLTLRVGGVDAVEIADDLVEATAYPPAGPVPRSWREWEAELLDGDGAVLDRVEPVLLAAGAIASLSFAKIARATGQLVPVARAAGADAATLDALEDLDRTDRAAGERRMGA